MTDYMKEAERLSRVLEDIAQTALRGVDSEQIRGHLMDASALLAHIQRGAVPDMYDRIAEAHDASMDEDHTGCRAILKECIRLLAAAPDHFRDAAEMVAAPEGWSLDESEAALLHHLTSPDNDGEHSPITLRAGNVRMDDGTVKFGLLCEYTDYPDEGAALLVECPESAPDHFRDAAADAPAPAEVPMPEPDLWLKQTSSAANPPHGWAVLFTPNGDASQVYLSSSMNIYGDAREAAGYAQGLAEAWRDAERSRRWISVTDENPSQGPCIVFSTWGVRYAYRHNPAWMDGFQDGETKIDEGSDHPSMTFSETFRVTHWMPWPSPPIAALRGEVK